MDEDKIMQSEHYQNAIQSFQKGNYQETLRQLIYIFTEYPSFIPAYELASKTLHHMKGEKESTLFNKAIQNFDTFQPFFDLGYHFIDVGHFRLAIPFLERAWQLNPGHIQTGLELSLAYTAQFRIKEAISILQPTDYETNFWVAYQLYYCRILDNQPDGVEIFLQEIRQFIASSDITEQSVSTIRYVTKTLDEMYQRLLFIENPEKHIRDWHFIQYGSMILDFFESDDYVAGGRYVALWGTYQNICRNLERLIYFLKKSNKLPEKVIALPDRDSEILALYISRRINCYFEYLNENNVVESNTLIISGDSKNFNDTYELIKIADNQTVFAYHIDWLNDTLFCPDIVALLSQSFYFPWNGGAIRIDPVTKASTITEADNRPSDEIVRELLKLNTRYDGSFDKHFHFYDHKKAYLKGSIKGGEGRLRFKSDSPVPGAYFT